MYDFDDEEAEAAHYRRLAEENSIRHLRDYYGLAVRKGMRVKYTGQDGTLVGFEGQYVRVPLDDHEEPVTCHPTSSMEYPPGTQVGPGPDERFAHLVQVHP